MKLLGPVLATLTLMSATAAQASISIPATDASVRWMGRTAKSAEGVTMGFPGTEIVLCFSGSAKVGMKGIIPGGEGKEGWFNVYLDGTALPTLCLGGGSFDITLAEGLDGAATHTLRLVRRNEAWQGLATISAFSLDDGAKPLEAPTPPSRRIMCIGDSITGGQNIELLDASRMGTVNANAELAYGWLLARDLGAQVNLVSYGGKGIVRDWRGLNNAIMREAYNDKRLASQAPEVITVPDFFERALPDDPATAWDHSAYQPDLILICIGQNDFSQISLPASEYAAEYIKFVERLRSVHPQASIILLSSPMAEQTRDDGWLPRGKALELSLSLVEQHFARKGDLAVRTLYISHMPGTQIDSHPVVWQHRRMADEILPLARAMTGWCE